MKIQVDTEAIRKGVQVVRNVVSGKGADAFLHDIMVKAEGDHIELSATNLEVSLQYRIAGATIEDPGMMLCPESKLAPILQEWQAESIGINESKRTCSIKGKGTSFRITCANPQAFPAIPKFNDKDCIEIDRNALVDMIKKVAFIGCDGVFLSVVKDEAIMVSNDGRRLAEVIKKIGVSKDASCIIPMKTIPQILNVIKDHEGAVKIKIGKKRIFVQAGNITLCSQLIEGQYPDYADVIPADLDKEITAEREVFFSAVRRAGVMTTDEFKLLSFTFGDNKLHLMCNSPDVGEAQVDIPVEYEGDKIVIGLNPDYVDDLSKVLDTDKVTMRLKDNNTACVFESLAYRYVLMPMELNANV
jgi:DNA polymerase-3 subunit beta